MTSARCFPTCRSRSARGEVVGLLGPNGAGKTTCFYSVMGLVKPDSGRIMLDGDDITGLPMYRRAILGPRLSAAGDLDLSRPDGRAEYPDRARTVRARTPSARRRGSSKLLDEFGLTRLRDAPAMALSGGERRRCRDRPRARRRSRRSCCSTSRSRASIRSRSPISAISSCELKKRGIGVLITDHNVRETLDIVDRACIIYDGHVLFAGSPGRAGRRRQCAAAVSGRGLLALRRSMASAPASISASRNRW